MFQTPRHQLSTAELVEQIIGTARVAPATPSSPELVAVAESIVGSLSEMFAPEALRELRSPRTTTNS